ncbi:MAG: DUF5916 domain-containing protein [Vicinamibacterales bacterium]
MKHAVAAVLVSVVASSSAAFAQGPSADAAAPVAPQTVLREPNRVVVRAVRLTTPFTLDGQLDEAIYRENMPIDGFTQQEPTEGAPATEPSEAWIFFDDENLYIGVRNWESDSSRMVLNELRKDSSNLIQNEHIAVILDTFHDRRNGFLFLVNALGGLLEETFVDERNASRDWNTVWDAKTARFDRGWSVEMAIPFKSLRYRPGQGQTWGINMNRVIKHKNEQTWLAPMPASYRPGVFRISQGATLVGLETPPLGKNLEIKPYAIGGLTTDRLASPALSNDLDRDAGVDIKYGLTRGLTADLTINTDFAQVEEDEQQVNLTRFSLFFPEKREFFLEGQGIFNFGGQASNSGGDTPIMFFSRSIGINRGRPQDILAGGRVTGRAGKYTLGLINIQTREEDATGAPATNFTVMRVRRDILGRSTIGALFTDRSKSNINAGGRNDLFGVDGLFTFFQNIRINSYLARSRTPGAAGDEWSYRGQFEWAPDRYGFYIERLKIGDDFNPEVGFMRRNDFTKTALSARFSPRPARDGFFGRRVRKFYYEVNWDYFQTPTGRLESRNAGAGFRAEFQNGDNLNANVIRSYDYLDTPFQIVTGVRLPVGAYDWQQGTVSYQLGTQRRVSGTTSFTAGSYYNGTQRTLSYRGRVAAATRLALEPSVSINWLDLDQGKFTTKLVGTRVTTPLTPRMFASVLLQYNSSNNSFSSNARFRWEYQPGSELFVVFTEGRNTIGPGYPDLDTRGFVVKINRLFRM